MIDYRADLHCHTTCSDGTESPEAVIKMAHEKGLSGLSLTDHDTIEAYKIAFPIAKAYQIVLIPGVEFSCLHREQSVHLLAYSFLPDSALIKAFCLQHDRQRQQRNHKILELLTANGMPLTEADIQDSTLAFHQTIGRPHIAAAMVKKGYVSSIQEAFLKYIAAGKSCYATGHYFSVEETIDLIHRANGLAIIAHPHLVEDKKIMGDLLQMKFDGIEGYYGRFPPAAHKRWVKIGERRGWIITGGSDFHGAIKPTIPLGCSWVNEETFKVLNDHFNNNQTAASP